eukprot:5194990-Alexandrium_andersonii.AAC.1
MGAEAPEADGPKVAALVKAGVPKSWRDPQAPSGAAASDDGQAVAAQQAAPGSPSTISSASGGSALSREDRKRKWAAFMRSFEPATKRATRKEKIPESIVLKISNDMERSH